ncbi:MAG: S26 family signal peptidase [Planctomycetaceae bacterium]|nr:S26 family signal peptidase [Planctomycetaceae bacterium]
MPDADAITRTDPGPTSGSASSATTTSGLTRSTGSLAVTQTVAAPPSTSLVRIQWIVAAVMVSIAIFAVVRLWMIEGLVRVARTDGPSMAPAFLGAHFRVTCEDCRFTFRCDAEHAPASGEVACPNCGYPINSLRDEDLIAGERVIIDRWPVVTRGVRRGEVVAAADPAHAGGLVIKRVAAGPGERLSIQDGDVYVDGRLLRKTWQELAQVRILVHDNSFQPAKTTGVPRRWQNAAGQGAWHPAMTGYQCQPADASAWNWLEYTHHQMFGWHLRTRQSPVLDLDSYNPSETRLLNSVSDVLLSCRLRNLRRGPGQFAVAVIDREQRFEAVIDPARQTAELIEADPEGKRRLVDREEQLLLDIGRGGVTLEFGLCDQQVILRIAGRQIFRHEYVRGEGPSDTHRPLEIGSQGLELAVDQLRVWRDIYYLAPDTRGGDWEPVDEPLAGSIALLGDNTSVSVDSRHWTSGVLPGSVRGVVYRPFWARR